MKKSFILSSLCLFCLLNIYSQADTLDPMRDDYMIAKLSQIVAISTDEQNKSLFLDVQNHSGEYKQLEAAATAISDEATFLDVIYDDFDGDGMDEMVTCYFDKVGSVGLVLDCYEYNPDIKSVERRRILEIPRDFLGGQTRLAAGNFDDDIQNELVLSHVIDTIIHFTICDIDLQGPCTVLSSSNSNRGYAVHIREGQYHHRDDMPIPRYAIACNDFDGDNISELVFIKKSIQSNTSQQHEISIYKIDPASNKLVEYSTRTTGKYYGAHYNYFSSLEVITTDLDGDGQDEVVFGFIWQEDDERERIINDDEYFRTFKPFLIAYKVSDAAALDHYSNYMEFEGWQYHSVHNRPVNWGKRVNLGMSLIHEDLDMDGRDEILFSDGRFLYLAVADPAQKSFSLLERREDFKSLQLNASRTLAVDYLMYDSVSSILEPRILSYAFNTDPLTTVHQIHPVFPQGGIKINEYLPDINATSRKVSGLLSSKIFDLQEFATVDNVSSYALVTPDLVGGGLQLGPPKRIHKKLTEPVVVLNTPPVHFDVFDGESFDISKQYFVDDPPFQSRYETVDSEEEFFETEVKRSIGFAAGLKLGADKEHKNVKFGGSIEAKVSKQWDRDSSTSETSITKIFENNTNELDDAVLLQVTDYTFWEYPVYLDFELLGNTLVLEPVKTSLEWQPTSELMLNLDYEPKFIPQHEIGNVLSYPSPNDEILDMGELIAETTTKSIDISNGGQGDGKRLASVEISYESIKNEGSKEGSKTRLELNSKAYYGVVTVSLDGNYEKNEIETRSSTIKASWNVACYLGPIDKQYSSASYDIKPYVYWRKDGALSIDYHTETSEFSGTGTWWENTYGELPDPTFILPFLNHEAKGIGQMEDYIYFTRDILTAPDQPEPGDTVSIRLTLRNFSLVDLEENVKVQLYIGHPEGRGELIVDPEGRSYLELSEPIDARGAAHLFIDWVVPKDIAPLARIFARIDGDNEVEEIHEGNNLAFTEIKVLHATGTLGEPEEIFTGLEEGQGSTYQGGSELLIFPNPSSQASTIRFYTESVERVSLEVYNTLGKVVEIPVHEQELMGLQEISLDVSAYPAGMFICRLHIGERVIQEKLLVQ